MPNADDALEMIQDFLSEPNAKEKISEALQMLTGESSSNNGNSPQSSSKENQVQNTSSVFSDIDPQKLMQIMTTFKKLKSEPDPRSDLLLALKPYLSKNKTSSVDKALKIISLLKFAPLLNNIKDISDIF